MPHFYDTGVKVSICDFSGQTVLYKNANIESVDLSTAQTCTIIGNLTCSELSELLSRMPSLQHLTIKDVKEEEIDPFDIDNFVQINCYATLPSLEILTITQSNCYQGGFQFLLYLCVPNLRHITITAYCANTNPKSAPCTVEVAVIVKFLNNCSRLEYINGNPAIVDAITNCSQSTDLLKYILKRSQENSSAGHNSPQFVRT